MACIIFFICIFCSSNKFRISNNNNNNDDDDDEADDENDDCIGVENINICSTTVCSLARPLLPFSLS